MLKFLLPKLIVMSLVFMSVLADSLNITTTSTNTTIKQTEEKKVINEPLPESETTGACSKQSSSQIQKRNCRYGKCEQIKNGTDFSCHCDEFITGRKCDRPSKDPKDACSSNPCWGDSICITIDPETKEFKCLCPSFRRGRFCHIKLTGPGMVIDDTVEAIANQNKHRPRPTKYKTTTIISNTITNTNYSTTLNSTSLILNNTQNSLESVTNNSSESEIILNGKPKNGSDSEISPKESRLIVIKINETNIEQDESLRTTMSHHERVSNITTRAILNTFVPISEFYSEPCNFDTCQLGKCLKNGTCECVPPAIGKFCDHIDECLILKCVHGKCITGSGCNCHKGYTGTTCEIKIMSKEEVINFTKATNNHHNIITTSNIFNNKTNLINKKLTITKQPILTSKISTTKAIKLKQKAYRLNTTVIKPIQTSQLSQTTKFNRFTSTGFPTTLTITSCENGGLLIDNVCICLNQFTGSRCEIAPGFSDQFSTTTTAIEKMSSRIPKTKNLIIGQSKNIKSGEANSVIDNGKENSTFPTTTIESDSQKLTESEDEYIPLFTISKYNSKTNKTVRRNYYWPWFECFPGDSRVYTIHENGKDVETKRLSELKVNDKVLVADDNGFTAENSIKFSKVVSFLHRIESIDANFVRLHYDLEFNDYKTVNSSLLSLNKLELNKKTNNYITLTPRHLILVNPMSNKTNLNMENFYYLPAGDVKPGDILKYYDYSNKIYKFVRVISKESVDLSKSGIYSPLTESGTIIVDNIQVSCYSIVKNHKLAQFFFNIMNNLRDLVKLTSQSYNSYAKFLYEMALSRYRRPNRGIFRIR